VRYPLVGGMRYRHFDGTSLKTRKLPENAQTPTSRVHAMLAGLAEEEHALNSVYNSNSGGGPSHSDCIGQNGQSLITIKHD
jgi:hypothetical protein